MTRLFDLPAPVIEGFKYARDLISEAEERALLDAIQTLPFGTVVFRGVAARRRVVQFGWNYEFGSRKVTPTDPIPAFLLPLQQRVSEFAEVEARRLEEVLVTEYQPGAGIGWHRDAPPFGIVAGVSLLSSCELRLRPIGGGRNEVVGIALDSRSVYLFSGAVRSDWQHSIPPTRQLRYSITFRTLRPSRGKVRAEGER